MRLRIEFFNLSDLEATKLLSSIGHYVSGLNIDREIPVERGSDPDISYTFEYSGNSLSNPRETNTFSRYITKPEERA